MPIDHIVFSASVVEILTVAATLLGGLAGIVVPFVIYSLVKRNREWSEMRKDVQALQKQGAELSVLAKANKERIQGLLSRMDGLADKALIVQLTTQIDTAKESVQEIERNLPREFVTIQQYQRDIDAFEKYIQLLRDSLAQQTDILERMGRR